MGHVANNESEDPNVFVYITHLVPPPSGSYVVGVAWVGTVCRSSKGYRVSINSWVSSDLGLSKVRYTVHNGLECSTCGNLSLCLYIFNPLLKTINKDHM